MSVTYSMPPVFGTSHAVALLAGSWFTVQHLKIELTVNFEMGTISGKTISTLLQAFVLMY